MVSIASPISKIYEFSFTVVDSSRPPEKLLDPKLLLDFPIL